MASSLVAYAAKGMALYEVRLALKFCTELTRSVPLGSQSGTSFSRRSLSSTCKFIIPEYGANLLIMIAVHQHLPRNGLRFETIL